MREYVLMHQDVPVLTVALTETNRIQEIRAILCDEHKPLNMQTSENQAAALSEFMKHRAIPNTRQNLSKILATYEADDPLDLSLKSYQLSLADHYWMKPIDAKVSWAQVNFFRNPLPHTPIFMTGGFDADVNLINLIHLMTPNSSVNGSLRQMWLREGQKTILFKAGKVLCLEPFNEVFVSKVLDVLKVPHIGYELREIDGEYVSACELFTDESIEFIPAWCIVGRMHPRDNKYEGLLKQCEELGIPNAREGIDTMIAMDYLTFNDDRHWGNFGFLRNSNTLHFIGMAPLFDNGNSLWYDQYRIRSERPFYTYPSQPFTTTHDKQIKYVQSDLHHLAERLDDVIYMAPQWMTEIYENSEVVTSTRLELMQELFVKRARELQQLLRDKGLQSS